MDGTISSSVTKCKRESLSGTHAWRIEGISDLLKSLKDLDQPSCHSCPFFLLGCQWKALFWPHGCAKKEFEDVASFQLQLLASPRSAKQTAKITVEVSHRPETRQQSKLWIFEPSDSEPSTLAKPCGFKNFLKQADFSKDDTLNLEITIELVTSRFERQELVIHATAAEQLAELQKTLQKELKDITLLASDKSEVPCNALLLSKASPVIANLLRYEPDKKQLDFKLWKTPALEIVANFVCAATLPAAWSQPLDAGFSDVMQVYEVCQEKMICRLLNIARVVLLRNTQLGNVHDVYQLAVQFNDLTMMRHLEEYARSNVAQLLKKRPIS